MSTTIYVHVCLGHENHLVGLLRVNQVGGRERLLFEYTESWLNRPERFALEPALDLVPGARPPADDRPVFGAIGDSMPDRWGRRLLRRREARLARQEGRRPRALMETDMLLQISDEARLGALRFSLEPEGPFLSQSADLGVPPIVRLHELYAQVRAFEAAESSNDFDALDDAIAFIWAPGSSLGGARPKLSVIDEGGNLAIAKFPSAGDEYSVEGWEAVSLELASRAGIEVPRFRLERIGGRDALILDRFDRTDDGGRIPFLSAMAALNAEDGSDEHGYLDILDILQGIGSQADADFSMLWRRMVFRQLISDTDGHKRNLGFLYDGERGWRLAPMYDVNAQPVPDGQRFLAIPIDPDIADTSVERCLEHAEWFRLSEEEAREIAFEVATAVSEWESVARRYGLSDEVRRMRPAFDHADMDYALSLGGLAPTL
jgi:serine/threonine-protein kinase HipA